MPEIIRPTYIQPEYGSGCGAGTDIGLPHPPLLFEECVKVNRADGSVVGLYNISEVDLALKELERDYADHERVLITLPGAKSYAYAKREEILGIVQFSGVDTA
jgi:hypothetical protein